CSSVRPRSSSQNVVVRKNRVCYAFLFSACLVRAFVLIASVNLARDSHPPSIRDRNSGSSVFSPGHERESSFLVWSKVCFPARCQVKGKIEVCVCSGEFRSKTRGETRNGNGIKII
ncbi:AAEL007020-PA, partial [Aedes aegypti]